MTIKQNKAVIRNFAELANGRDLDGVLSHFNPSFVDHAVRQGMPTGIGGARMFFKMFFTAFLDLLESRVEVGASQSSGCRGMRKWIRTEME